MELAKWTGCMVASILLLVILHAILPYVLVLLAVCGAYYLYQRCHPNN